MKLAGIEGSTHVVGLVGDAHASQDYFRVGRPVAILNVEIRLFDNFNKISQKGMHL